MDLIRSSVLSLCAMVRREREHNTVRVTQLILAALAGAGAFLTRFDFRIPPDQVDHMLSALLIWVILKPLAFECFGLSRRSWRFVSVGDAARLLYTNVAASVSGSIAILVFARPGFPRSIYVMDFALCLLFTAGAPVGRRLGFEMKGRRKAPNAERVLIYGAGAAGVSLLRELHANPSLYEVCGFIDDDSVKQGTAIHGVRVLGGGADLEKVTKKYYVRRVLIAAPSSSGSEMAAILQNCHNAGVRCHTIPRLFEIISGRCLVSQVREVAVEDILSRDPVVLDEEGLFTKLAGQRVLVTGAAGSIGSEICRQLARYRPRSIIGFEMSETPLFFLEREMRERYPDVQFVPEIGNIQNLPRVLDILHQYAPAIVYHAAAYKHVPLMEGQLFEAVENNILGTYNVVTAAVACGVEDFVMISTDKAVHPTSIMGATKRTAELIVNSVRKEGHRYVSVRFGNVLGSNGSVVPLFKKQVAEGGPVKVTHPEMQRYFMTIPEAAQLVLQASVMGHGGEVFVLDMGRPVRIVDLARKIILLSGFTPDVDIKIEFTGIRPGEKLYEELGMQEESVRPTFHEKIKIFAGNGFPLASAESYVISLHRCCVARDAQSLLLQLKDLVPDYNPSVHVLRCAIGPQRAITHARKAASVMASAAND